VAVKKTKNSGTRLRRWREQLLDLRTHTAAPRTCVQDVLDRVIPFFFLGARNMADPCILSSKRRAPCLRTNCGYTPGAVSTTDAKKWPGK
jgi:hypothetical protein